MSASKPVPLPADVMARLEKAYAELAADLDWANMKVAAFMVVSLGAVYLLYRLASANHPQIVLFPSRPPRQPAPVDAVARDRVGDDLPDDQLHTGGPR